MAPWNSITLQKLSNNVMCPNQKHLHDRPSGWQWGRGSYIHVCVGLLIIKGYKLCGIFILFQHSIINNNNKHRNYKHVERSTIWLSRNHNWYVYTQGYWYIQWVEDTGVVTKLTMWVKGCSSMCSDVFPYTFSDWPNELLNLPLGDDCPIGLQIKQ